MTAALRWVIPVDDRPHTIPCGPGPILGVECRNPPEVELWVSSDYNHDERTFIVVGTGDAWPDASQYVGMALTPAGYPAPGVAYPAAYGALVWHLLEVTP